MSASERPANIEAEYSLPTTGDDVPSWVTNPEQCRVVSQGHVRFLDIEADTDPYTRVEWRLGLDALRAAAGRDVVIEIAFFDDGAGVIDPRLVVEADPVPISVAPTRKSSYTRLNTQQPRHAWFAFTVPGGAGDAGKASEIRVAGLQHLVQVRVLSPQSESEWRALQEAVPRDVKPMVHLERPVELVTTAGVDVTGGMATLQESLDNLNDLAPLARVLGFTSIESYVTWKRLEPEREGEFNFSYYDAITEKLACYGLKWFPLLIVGSAYALPDWFADSDENIGFECIEHGMTNAVQSIWSPCHKRHVTRFLQAFGEHYEPMGVLEGVRLGPSGNYGESQYPAGGNWGFKGEKMHIHIGWWAGDRYGREDFRRYLREKYDTVGALNAAWDADYTDFGDVEPSLPQTMQSKRQRLDFTAWYTDSMSEWCAWWAEEARKAMPNTAIYQCAGGWGFRETGTDYVAQTKDMKPINGGVRLTNEVDSFDENVYVTRLAATAARLYGVRLGYEPAASHTARGAVGRIFNTVATNGDHLFTYHPNIVNHPLSIEKWLAHVPLFDVRQEPFVEVAMHYPETSNQLDDSTFRHLYAWGFYPRAREARRVVDADFLDETLIREGFLDRYKVLVFGWGAFIEADVIEPIDAWLRAGGVIIYPSYPRGMLETIEGDSTVFRRWVEGDTGQGRFHRFPGDYESDLRYGRFIRDVLFEMDTLHSWTKQAIRVERPHYVYLTVQQDGHLLALNFEDEPATIRLNGGPAQVIESYAVARLVLDS